MMKAHAGGCHCGAVRFECDLDAAAETSRCSCSICARGRFWKTIAKKDAFRLVKGADMVTEYGFGSGTIRHCFCRQCGIKPFGRGNMEELGGVFYAINVACLDGDAPLQFAAREIVFQDGANNDWSKPPAETRHL
jgi:hypothetical protein